MSSLEEKQPNQRDVEFDLLSLYMHNILLSKYSFPISCILIAAFLLQWENPVTVGLWLSLLLLFLCTSTYICTKFGDGSQIKPEDRKRWYYLIGIPRFAYMLTWSSMCFWAWTPAHPQTYFIVVAILVSTIAMNASQSSAVFRFYLMEMFPKISAIIISAVMGGGDQFKYTIAFMSIIAVATFTKIAKGIHASQRLILKQKLALEDSRDEVERASRAKSSFLATMSHEVRTPLNGILGIINLLKYTTLNKQQDEYVETIRYSGETLLTMLNDILDFSKMEAGKLDLEEVPFETSRLVQSVIGLMWSRATEKNIEIKTEIFDSVPAYICADPTRLRQVLLNLMSNAIKFTEEGSVTLSIKSLNPNETTAKPQDIMHLVFEIRDTGIGIPKEARKTLFGDFTQVDSSTSRKYGGSGLGLSICRRIVEMMRGKIDYRSIEGEGSTFWFEIPAIISTTEEVANTSERSEEFPVLRPLNILLAEDNIINQKVAVGLLSKFNHKIDIVNNGQEAIDAVKLKKYDLVLMDMQMPVIDGIEATRQIREMGGIYQNLPIVALTANSLQEEGMNWQSSGMTAHVTKPIRLSHLFKTIAVHLPDDVLVTSDRRSIERH